MSEAGLSRYVAMRAARARKIRHVPNGIDTNAFHPNRKPGRPAAASSSIEDEFVWLAVARLEELSASLRLAERAGTSRPS